MIDSETHLEHVRAGNCPAVRPFAGQIWCELPVDHHGPHRALLAGDGWAVINRDPEHRVYW